jgi:hypothetical protein
LGDSVCEGLDLGLEALLFAQLFLQLLIACLLTGELLKSLLAFLFELLELVARGLQCFWFLLQPCERLLELAQGLLFGFYGALQGIEQVVIGVAEWLPAGGAFALGAQGAHLRLALLVLRQVRLVGFESGFGFRALFVPCLLELRQRGLKFGALRLELLAASLGLLDCIGELVGFWLQGLQGAEAFGEGVQFGFESGALGGLLGLLTQPFEFRFDLLRSLHSGLKLLQPLLFLVVVLQLALQRLDLADELLDVGL